MDLHWWSGILAVSWTETRFMPWFYADLAVFVKWELAIFAKSLGLIFLYRGVDIGFEFYQINIIRKLFSDRFLLLHTWKHVKFWRIFNFHSITCLFFGFKNVGELLGQDTRFVKRQKLALVLHFNSIDPWALRFWKITFFRFVGSGKNFVYAVVAEGCLRRIESFLWMQIDRLVQISTIYISKI